MQDRTTAANGLGYYKLDNAATIYPAIQRERYSSMYRLTAKLTEKIVPDRLQEALDRTLRRFPLFDVCIKKGVFWYYFEPNFQPGPFVQPDTVNPCKPVRYDEENGYLFRLCYYEDRVALEMFHALSDGIGTLTFFKTLLAVYLRLGGVKIPNTCGILDVEAPPRWEEQEDAYLRYATSAVRRTMKDNQAYPATGTPLPYYSLSQILGEMSVAQVKEAAGQYGASITEYMSAILIQALLKKQAAEQPPDRQQEVALAIPINLRPYFPSETLRNFILNVRPSIDPNMGEYSFPEIVRQVHHYMRLNINRQYMRAQMTRNVYWSGFPLVRSVPLVFKDPVIARMYQRTGNLQYSATFTNPGVVELPEEMSPYIQRMEMMLGQSLAPRANCGAISHKDRLVVTFVSTIEETDLERDFFRHLVRDGVHVKIESNRE